MNTSPLDLIRNEPVAVAGLIQAGLAVALAFGWHVNPEQIGEIMAFVAAILALVARNVVTPTANPSPAVVQQAVLQNAADLRASWAPAADVTPVTVGPTTVPVPAQPPAVAAA